MFSRRIIVQYLFILACAIGNTQDCALSIKGSVSDKASETPLSYVNVFLQELSQGTITDDNGQFSFEGVCPGEYHLTFSHIGCEDVKMHLELSSDTILDIKLSHTPTSLGTVVIEGKKEENVNQPNLSINRKTIEDNGNLNLSGLLENETGVHLLKNGSGISKPVVHGLYGVRLAILNNGILQSGQQWGNDHTPEIDPFAADKVIVLKGASAIEYGGNLGSVILVEPKKIEREPHLHGQVNYAFESNGRGHNFNTRLEKYSEAFSWRINGTLKKYGDRRSPDYFLNNTGYSEANLSLQVEKSVGEKLFLDFYASTFNTQLGVLRGSHIGNLTDLEQALSNDIPFFTEPDFSYTVDAPRQEVSHNLLKSKIKYYIRDNQSVQLVLAGQLNNRNEYDIRRSGRSDIPALSLNQFTFNAETKYSYSSDGNWNLEVGNQAIITDNTNNPETGILPLIPDYISWKNGLFTTLAKRFKSIHLNLGLRYDYEYQTVKAISNTIPKEIITFNNNFNNISGLLALKYSINKVQSITVNTGYTTRNPAINELYSAGLHQGVSGIEEGDINLETEHVFKTTLEYKWIPDSRFSFSAIAYHQAFSDYIFLNPQDVFRVTIRGAFPVFKYEQTDATISGIDISTQFNIGSSLFASLKYSYLKGQDTQNNIPLVFMPPTSFYGSLIYRARKTIHVTDDIRLEETEIEFNNRLVLRQNNILPEQDFTLPPSTYNLVGIKVSTNLIFPNQKIRIFAKATNLLNVKYRDYLNRQRYFSDDLGISVTTGINLKF